MCQSYKSELKIHQIRILSKMQPTCLSRYYNSLWAFNCAGFSKSHVKCRTIARVHWSCESLYVCVHLCVQWKPIRAVSLCNAYARVWSFVYVRTSGWRLWSFDIPLLVSLKFLHQTDKGLNLWCWRLSVIVSCRYGAVLVSEIFFKVAGFPQDRGWSIETVRWEDRVKAVLEIRSILARL